MDRTWSNPETHRLQSFSEKQEGKGLLGRPRRRWEGNIKMDLRQVGCGPEIE